MFRRVPRWLRWSALVALLAVLAGGVWLAWAARSTPDWFADDGAAAPPPAERDAAAARVDQQLLAIPGFVGQQLAAGQPGRFKLVLTEAELNAFWQKWSAFRGVDAELGKYVQRPQVRLRDGAIHLGGRSAQLGTVVWLSLTPQNGRVVRLESSGLHAGRLRLPDRLARQVTGETRRWADDARAKLPDRPALMPTGDAERAAVGLAQLDAAARGEIFAAWVFLPSGGDGAFYPATVEWVAIEDRTLTAFVSLRGHNDLGGLRALLKPPAR